MSPQKSGKLNQASSALRFNCTLALTKPQFSQAACGNLALPHMGQVIVLVGVKK
jgi:hypothetical protein